MVVANYMIVANYMVVANYMIAANYIITSNHIIAANYIITANCTISAVNNIIKADYICSSVGMWVRMNISLFYDTHRRHASVLLYTCRFIIDNPGAFQVFLAVIRPLRLNPSKTPQCDAVCV